jgi:general stress protein 13/S1 RNA binding domain protein
MAETKVIIGNIYSGTVLKIKPFGAIISLPGGVPGLVHISQITNGYVQNVSDVLNVGDEVDVRVVSHEEATGKISLSMKDVPQSSAYAYDDEDSENEEYPYRYDTPTVITAAQAASFEEKFKSWQKISNERIAGINRRNKRR